MNIVCVIIHALPWRVGYPLPFLPWVYALPPPAGLSPKPSHRQLIGWYTSGFQ